MGTENWYQVKEILELAIGQPPDQRERFLAEKCSGDAVLRSKIDSLISSYERVGSFMEDGAIGDVAEMITGNGNDLRPGDRLTRYEIVKTLGEGGMGKVYLANDVDLDRKVALKVLRDDLWWYRQARQRLIREARAAARLDHPNICAIYEIVDTEDRSFIVMQYIEGETLGAALVRKRFSIAESVAIAIQIAAALEEAHSRQIIHRDIKPANVVINEKDQIKVLDFGLAKFIEPQREEEFAKGLSSSGAVMGTVPYMSPEQLRGKLIDGRSDIFSFGALFYEILSGRQAFSKDNNAEAITAILHEEPDLSILPTKFQPFVRKTLMKDRSERYQTAGDLLRDLRELSKDTAEITEPHNVFSNWFGAKSALNTAFERIFSSGTRRTADTPRQYHRWKNSDSDARTVRQTEPISESKVTSPQTTSFRRPAIFIFGILVLILAGTLILLLRPSITSGDPHSFDALKPVQVLSWKSGASSIYSDYRASHNGKMIAYSSTEGGPNEGIYVSQASASSAVRVTKDEWKNHSPIWSPDDQNLAFASVRNGNFGIYTSNFLGGETSLLKDVGEGSLMLVHWSKDGSSISYEFNGNLYKLDIATRETSKVTNFPSSRAIERNFDVSSDETAVVYVDKNGEQPDLFVQPLTGGEPIRLTNDNDKEIRPRWHADGKRILYSGLRDNHYQINVAYLDGREPEQITRGDSDYELMDVSPDNNRIFYLSRQDRSDVWGVKVGGGEESPIASEAECEFWPTISPDGKSIAYQTNSSPHPALYFGESRISESTIVVRSMDNPASKRSINGYDPRWLSDGRRIAFLRPLGGDKKNALWTLDTVSGDEKTIIEFGVTSPSNAVLPYNRSLVSEFSWSPVNEKVAYPFRQSGISNILIKSADGNDATNLSANTDPNVTCNSPIWSRDGKRLAYLSIMRLPGDQRSTSYVWIAEQGKPKAVYSAGGTLRMLGWSEAGEVLFEATDTIMKASPMNVKLVGVTLNGASHSITTFKNIYPISMTLSADGRSAAFTAREDNRDNIWIADIAAGGLKKITSNGDPKLFYGSLTWSPDGKNIFFDKQDEIITISMFENFK